MESFVQVYHDKVVKDLQSKFNYENKFQIPKLSKICINMGVGEAVSDSKVINAAVGDMTAITGQKPVITKSRKSNASFKIREGMSIGCKVTLRRQKMFEFLERLVLVALPRLRDFRGFSVKNFDGNGNLSFGLKEQIIFPEINYDKIDQIRGMDITIVTTASNDEQAKELLSGFNIPFSK